MKQLNQKGVTLVEMLIAVAILAVMAVAVISARYYAARQTVNNSDKAFATQKAVQMIEELKTLVSGQEKLGTSTLFDYADGATTFNPILTTDQTVVSPADPLSQNKSWNNGWRFFRHVEIAGLPSDPNGAIVTVRVFRSTDGVTQGDELSNVTTVLRTIVSTFSPTQSMDVYILALSNIQGWWAQVPSMLSTFDAIRTSMQIENPGLEIHQHYITRTAFGRDPFYSPYINNSSRTIDAPMPSVYFYPGATVDQSGNPSLYFDPNQLASCGKILEDGAPVNTSSQFVGCPSYSVCDMYNHAVRYPDELATYKAVTTAWNAAKVANGGIDPCPFPEISLRMLLEGMYSQPASFTNALILNLHGELLPVPAMRNYSDAAKDIANLSLCGGPNVRVVTHPENLQYASGSNVSLRVYGYLDGLSDPTTLDSFSTATVAQTITVFLPDLGIVPANISVTAVVGNDTVAYSRVKLLSGAVSMGMSWNASNPTANQTAITLINTPLRCPNQAVSAGGLKNQNRLYGAEYIPCPIGGSFALDLTDNTNANNNPKNTARWVISFTMPVGSDGQHSIETRLGQSLVTNPPNLSRTYVWVGATPPITEQFQFVGDPRHCPYKDVFANAGYNWYFKNFSYAGGTDGYTGYGQASANGAVTGWGGDHDERDIPRYYSVLRHGLLNTHAIWTTMNGFSYYYIGQGGEFGSDAAPFSNGISFYNNSLWTTGALTAPAAVDEILPGHTANPNARVVASTDNKWYAKYWLGELYPDALYTTWKNTGNLPSGTGSGTFYRALHSTFTAQYPSNPTCSGFQRNLAKRTGPEGCIAMLNGTSSGTKTFRHDSNNGQGTLQPLGNLCYPILFFPLASPVSCTRPWSLGFNGSTGNYPSEWSVAPYNGDRTSLTLAQPNAVAVTTRVFYSSAYAGSGATTQWSPYYASGVVKATEAGNSAYFIISGLSVQANFGTYELGKSALVFMLRTFLDGGLYTSAGDHITQLPLVTLQNPPQAAQLNNPATQPVSWTSAWKRWGGNVYTEEFPVGWTESSVNVQFNAKYSNDDGKTWLNLSDNTPTNIGQLDVAHAVTVTSTSWDLSNATQFPRGNYELRVEAFRPNLPLHYSYHQTNLYINR